MATKYKDSGIPWIGMIPNEWEVISFKQVVKNVTTGLNPRNNFVLSKDDSLYYVTIRNFKDGVLFLDDNCDRIDKNAWDIIQNRSDLQKGDILFASISKDAQCYIVNEFPHNWNINESVFSIRGNNEYISEKFLYYSLINPEYYNSLRVDATGTTFQSIKQKKLKDSYFPIPPLPTQQRIADFLDRKCAEIDELAALQETMIAELKRYKQSVITESVTKGLDPNVPMQDSGVEWIGEIPEGWKVNKGKHILSLQKREVRTDDEVVTCFRDGEVILRSERRTEGFTFSDKEIGYQGINKGDIVIHGMDGFAGAMGVSKSTGKGSPVLIVCLPSHNDYPEYIIYYLRTLAMRNVFLALATGIRERSCDLRWNKISELLFLTPPPSEQRAIADYLDEKCVEIDELIAIKQQKIEALKEYKRSVIFEYVTGKKEVE